MNSPWNSLPLADSSSTSCGVQRVRAYAQLSLSRSVSVARAYTCVHARSWEREGERDRVKEMQPSFSLSFSLSLPSFPRHVETCSVTGFSVGTGLLLRGIHVSPLPLRTWLAYVQAGTEAGGGGMILRVERERERDRDRRPFSVFFFSRDTGSFSIACTVNDHFAPSFRVIQRGVERSSFLPPSSFRVGYLFIATIDSLLPPLPPSRSLSSFSESVGILLFLFCDSYLRS